MSYMRPCLKIKTRSGEMTLAIKSDDWSLILRIHMVEGDANSENCLLTSTRVLWL